MEKLLLCVGLLTSSRICSMVLAGDSKRENSIPTLWPDWPDWPDLTGAPTCLSLYKFVIYSVDSVYFLTRPWRLVRP